MNKITVGVADDHPVVLQGVQHMLLSSPDIDLHFQIDAIKPLLVQLVESPVDVLLCDYEFEGDPEADGLHLLGRIRRIAPHTRVLFLSCHCAAYTVSAALSAGASGFIGKRREDFANLITAIHAVKSRGFYLADSIASRLLATTGHATNDICLSLNKLSAKEAAVVRLICNGLSINDIAKRLKRSPKTISNQKNAGMKKLGVKNDIELASVMREWR
ncbi:response regulator transcription factor [Burkholderia glumae]|uniref:Response regulator transcription factor n=2 Tax=Burkholderia glumae TaxID=337 RepID=A0AAQ0BT90_BURGL|nr:response regulator transcription factor [Burkholderia glumae]ACR30658.1 LuxR family transcriptional regulator [Burkholderia glumae BGR1]KHJ62683.1 chemotaxis protein CheY [Burkholderia glumae]MCR1770193.1 response regulator transcription factor [Burkholderia glumae]PNL04999.1 DNA-binding response regulator [Burkholderia glumae]QHP93613.1 response regulator transcription factor [Burkholderia glumae]